MPQLNRPNKILSLITGQAVPGNAGVALMARIRGNNHALVTQASLSSITYTVYNVQPVVDGTGSATVVTTSTALTIPSVIYDSLQQQDGLWVKDGPGNLGPDGSWGYNFKTVIPASNFTVAASGDRYRVDVKFTPTSGEPFRLPFEFTTIQVYA